MTLDDVQHPENLTSVRFIISFLLSTLFFSHADSVEAQISKVGVLAPLTGEMSVFGKKAVEGIKLALDSKKETISYTVEDVGTGAKAEVAKATSKLISINQVDVLIGAFFLDQTLVAGPIAEKAKIPLISFSLCSTELKKFKIVACGYPSTEEQLDSLNAIFQKLGTRQLAFLIENSVYGADTARVARSIAEKSGAKVEVEDNVNSEERDFRTIITRMKRKSFDTVFSITTDPGQTFSFFRQLKEQGFKGARIGYLDIDPKYLEEFGDSIDGVYLPGLLPTNFSGSFETAFTNQYGRRPDMYSAQGYDIAQIVAQGLNDASSSLGKLERILAVRLTDSALPNYHFRSDRTISVPVSVFQIRDRQYIEIDIH